MAIDKTNITLDIASMGVEDASRFMKAIERFSNLLGWGVDAGLSFTNFDDDLAAAPELQHVDGATLNELFAVVIPGIKDFMDNNTVASGDTYTEVLQKARRS